MGLAAKARFGFQQTSSTAEGRELEKIRKKARTGRAPLLVFRQGETADPWFEMGGSGRYTFDNFESGNGKKKRKRWRS